MVWASRTFTSFFYSCCDIFKRLASLLTRVTSFKSPKLQSVSELVSGKGRQWSDLCPIKLNRNDTEQVPGSNHHLSPRDASAPSSLSKSAGHHRESNPLKQQIAKFSTSCPAFIAFTNKLEVENETCDRPLSGPFLFLARLTWEDEVALHPCLHLENTKRNSSTKYLLKIKHGFSKI